MVQFPDAERYSSLPKISRKSQDPTQPPSQLVSEFLHGIKQQKLEAEHCQPVPKLIMSETKPPLYHTPSWSAQRQHYFSYYSALFVSSNKEEFDRRFIQHARRNLKKGFKILAAKMDRGSVGDKCVREYSIKL